ncbi:MAG: helix-turn-helix domain-containing protein [Bacteroidia bacterium]
MKDLQLIQTVTEAHMILGVKKPKHPLVSVIPQNELHHIPQEIGFRVRVDLFQIWMKEGVECEIGYGRNSYDFGEGTLAFMKAGQVLTHTGVPNNTQNGKGWLLLFHPDLIRKSELGKKIHTYTFFDYEVSEALHVSEEERKSLTEIVKKIEKELSLNLDKHSQGLIVSNIELLLNYCARYYDRQFYTRSNLNQDLASKFENLLRDYYNSQKPAESGLPTVKYCGEQMNMSSHYLSDLLKKETGRNAQEHIHHFVIDKAKTMLLGSTEPVSQIAYGLGFEYPQHFTKLFKAKTGMSPVEYKSLN